MNYTLEQNVGLLKAASERLSRRGWRFYRRVGPLGIFYEGFGPRGLRMLSSARSDEKAALADAILHAHRLTQA